MTPLSRLSKPVSSLRDFLRSETSAGLILMVAAALALVIANSGWRSAYFAALQVHLGPMELLHWINDGLMTLFFLLVGLEIKREFLDGQLRSWPSRALPGIAALGGMVVPALVYAAVNRHSPGTLHGMAIPAATDIAFALGVLALVGSRVPASLRIFLTALAILDDLGAVLIIAVFYTADLSLPMLGAVAVTLALLWAMNLASVTRLWPYLLLGLVLWMVMLRSGVHATVAGVLLAIAIPLRPGNPKQSPLHRLEHALQPWCAFLVLPVFGFANAGLSLSDVSLSMIADPVPLGVALGLVLGKQVGVFGGTAAAVWAGLARRPAHTTWGQVYGVALLCGVGFTMSLFISLLAFSGRPDLQNEAKAGVLLGSLVSMGLGAAVLRFLSPARPASAA